MGLLSKCADAKVKHLGPCKGRVVYGPCPIASLAGNNTKIYLCEAHAKARLRAAR